MFFSSVVRSSSAARNFVACSCVAAAFLVSLPTAGLLHAAAINYGDFGGNTVDYLQVTEDSNSGDTPPLFGAPSVTGDSIDFNPVGFSASSAGVGSDLTDGNLKFDVKSDQGFAIKNISFAEAGDTGMAGVGTDGTSTSVSANVFINIKEVDGAPINVVALATQLAMSPSGGTFGLATDGGGNPFFVSPWSGSLLVDINQALIDNNIPFNLGATLISVNIDNTLSASSEAGTTAFIAKKDFGGLSVTVNKPGGGEIPEPSTIALLALGLAAACVGRRVM